MGVINWEKYRRKDGSLNLKLAYDLDDKSTELSEEQDEVAYDFLSSVERCQPIVSRQAASIALNSAMFFAQAYFVEE